MILKDIILKEVFNKVDNIVEHSGRQAALGIHRLLLQKVSLQEQEISLTIIFTRAEFTIYGT